MQQAPAVGNRNDRLGIMQPAGYHLCAFQRINRHIDQRAVLVPDLFPNIEHRRLVHFAFADHDGSVNGDGIKHGTYSGCSGIIRRVLVTPANPAG
ncbi:hypothetical protein D3C81_1539500 [compost metagenome]